jgi:hypothetical protein
MVLHKKSHFEESRRRGSIRELELRDDEESRHSSSLLRTATCLNDSTLRAIFLPLSNLPCRTLR